MSMYDDDEEIIPATPEQQKMIDEMKRMNGRTVGVVGADKVEIASGKAEVLNRIIIINSSNGRFIFPTVKYKYIKSVDVRGGKVYLNVTVP